MEGTLREHGRGGLHASGQRHHRRVVSSMEVPSFH
jgi:hypothetical protein